MSQQESVTILGRFTELRLHTHLCFSIRIGILGRLRKNSNEAIAGARYESASAMRQDGSIFACSPTRVKQRPACSVPHVHNALLCEDCNFCTTELCIVSTSRQPRSTRYGVLARLRSPNIHDLLLVNIDELQKPSLVSC